MLARIIGVPPGDVEFFSEAITRMGDLGAVPLEPALPGLEWAITELSSVATSPSSLPTARSTPAKIS